MIKFKLGICRKNSHYKGADKKLVTIMSRNLIIFKRIIISYLCITLILYFTLEYYYS